MTTTFQFYYETYGDKTLPPLLFLHGFMGSTSDWDSIARFFSKKHYCLAIDLPGHGKTQNLNDNSTIDDYRIENCAANIISLIDKLHFTKTNLIGYSMGGRLAFYLAVNYPDRFTKVIVESASPGLETEKERKRRIINDKELTAQLENVPLEHFLEYWYSQRLFENIDKYSDNFRSLLQRRLANKPESLKLSLKCMGTGIQPSLWNRLDKINSDILLIVGANDDKFKHIASRVSKKCQTAQIKVIDNAGHNVHFENREEFIRQVKLFLEK